MPFDMTHKPKRPERPEGFREILQAQLGRKVPDAEMHLAWQTLAGLIAKDDEVLRGLLKRAR